MQDSKNKIDQQTNPLDEFSSELKPILIPLHNFKHYHDSDNLDCSDDSYIGRETIIGKLKNWITNEDTLAGTYLVTGYRGMGKTSFVNRVLKEIQASRKFINKSWFIAIKVLLILLTLLLCVINAEYRHDITICYFFISLLAGALILMVVWGFKLLIRINEDKDHNRRNINNGKLRTEYLEVRINIGKEIITKADDIMRLIVKSVYNGFKEYVYNCPHKHMLYSYLKLCIMLTITFFVISYTELDGLYFKYENFSAFFAEIYTSLLSLNSYYNYGVTLCLSIVLMGISYCLTNFIFRLIGKIKFFGFPTFEQILSDLSRLYDRTVASVEEGDNAAVQHVSFFSRFKRYERATLREMEQELIHIFDDVSRITYFSRWSFTSALRFVIVLDELDKVDVAESDASGHDDLPYYDVSASGFAGSQNARKRKQQLMKTLANMKYFLSTVKAKFIFVGGRELFDAYLGDVSDREYSISSVFDGVLNINSFFSSGVKGSDVTAMTEEFVCSKLCPSGSKKVKTLQDYHAYLTELEDDPDSDMDEPTKNRLITFLYQYILYLIHISNGSPKKITVFFEKNIRTKEHLTNLKKVKLPKHRNKTADYYLSFGVKDIYKVGFMHYISYPLIQTMSGKANIFDDKLLVSTSFIINHIYKYHNTGFSWRNLEHIPELLDMNKTPELRDFLGSIVALLNQTHLASIQSGLYLFKFPMRISEEISFISKQIEDISALFHFSKDESQPVKRHYIHQLDYYTHSRNNIKDVDLYTLASLHHILGDIYQADEDYSQAIYEYQTGLQLVSRQLNDDGYDLNPHWISKMLFIMRNMLKMGVAFEKRKTYDSAYTTYSELNQHLFDYREFKEGDVGLAYYLYKKDPAKLDWDALLYKKAPTNEDEKEQKTDDEKNISQQERFMWDEDNKGDKDINKSDYRFASDQLIHEFTRIPSPKKLAILMRQSIFSDIRMAYLPTLAKLFVLEKMDTEGITSSNLEIAESEFFYLHLFVNDELRPLIYSDFFQKMGDILYYKNGLPDQPAANILFAVSLNGYDVRTIRESMIRSGKTYCNKDNKIDSWFEMPKELEKWPKELNASEVLNILKSNAGEEYDNSKGETINDNKMFDDPRLLSCMRQRVKMSEEGKRIPCHSCKYYNMSFASILKNLLNITLDQHKSKTSYLMTYLLQNKQRLSCMPQNSLMMIANTLKGLANAKLSCSDKDCVLNDEFLSSFFDAFRCFYKEEISCSCTFDYSYIKATDNWNNLEKALMLYVEAGMFFTMACRTNDASQMYRQVLEIFNLYLRVYASDSSYQDKHMSVIERHLDDIEVLVNITIRLLYGNYEGINLLEVSVLKGLFCKNAKSDVPLNHLPINPDVEELIYRYYALYLRCDRMEVFDTIYSAGIMGGYRQLCTFSQDVQNLRFKFMMNSKIVERLTGIKRPETLEEESRGTVQLFINLTNYLKSDTNTILKELNNWGIISEDSDIPCSTDAEKLDVLNFFIIDTLSCLSKIRNKLFQLNNPTTYISYFMADICLYIAFWRKIYDELAILYDDADEYRRTYTLKQDSKYSNYDRTRQRLPGYQKLYQSLSDERVKTQFDEYSRQRINNNDMEHLFLAYNAEQAIQYYENAKEMHNEGRCYKENILTLYFLDDDLNNDSIQQNMALERYLINTGNISARIRMLQGLLKSSRLFDNRSYLN